MRCQVRCQGRSASIFIDMLFKICYRCFQWFNFLSSVCHMAGRFSDDIDSIFLDLVHKKGVDIAMNTDNVDSTAQQLFKILF